MSKVCPVKVMSSLNFALVHSKYGIVCYGRTYKTVLGQLNFKSVLQKVVPRHQLKSNKRILRFHMRMLSCWKCILLCGVIQLPPCHKAGRVYQLRSQLCLAAAQPIHVHPHHIYGCEMFPIYDFSSQGRSPFLHTRLM